LRAQEETGWNSIPAPVKMESTPWDDGDDSMTMMMTMIDLSRNKHHTKNL
jgi:hypothetical protein